MFFSCGIAVLQNFEKSITTRELHDTFSDFGDILSCKVAVDKDGKSKGYGFVHFADPASAKAAIEAVNGAQLGESDKVVTVTEFVSKQDRGDPKQHFTNVYVKSLPPSVKTEEDVKTMFGEFGEISSVAMMKVCTDGDLCVECCPAIFSLRSLLCEVGRRVVLEIQMNMCVFTCRPLQMMSQGSTLPS